MRKRRIGLIGALGVALVAAIPGTALAGGTFKVDSGFSPEIDAGITFPPPVADIGSKQSKGGTLRVGLPLENPTPVLPSTGVINIHSPEELTYETKGLAQCDPADITGQSEAGALAACDDALVGEGSAINASAATGAQLPVGKVLLFNGTPQNGNPTVLFDSLFPIPGTVIVSEMQNSPLPGFGTVFVAKVAVSSGGPVPDGVPIVDTQFTNSKKFTDEKLKKKSKKLKKKAKKAKKQGNKKKYKKLNKKSKKKKKQSKKSWVTGKCTDGELTTRVDWDLVGGGTQTDSTTQACT